MRRRRGMRAAGLQYGRVQNDRIWVGLRNQTMPRYRPDGSMILYKQSRQQVTHILSGERGVVSTYLDDNYELSAIFQASGTFSYIPVSVDSLDVTDEDAERLGVEAHMTAIESARVAQEAEDEYRRQQAAARVPRRKLPIRRRA